MATNGDNINFGQQAQHIRQINQSLVNTEKLLSNQLKLQEAINASLSGGLEEYVGVGEKVSALIRDKLNLDTSLDLSTSRIRASTAETTSILNASTNTSRRNLEAQKDILLAGTAGFSDETLAMLADAIEVGDGIQSSAVHAAGTRYDNLLRLQDVYGEGVLQNEQQAGAVVTQAMDAYIDSQKAFTQERIGTSNTAYQQIFKSEKDLNDYLDAALLSRNNTERLMQSDMAKQLPQLAARARGMGLTAEQFSTVLEVMVNKYGSFNERAFDDMQTNLRVYADESGMHMKSLSHHLNDLKSDYETFGGSGEQSLTHLSAMMQKAGLNSKDLQPVIQNFQDFEKASTSIGKINQLMGINLNASKLMVMANNDAGGAMQMMKDAIDESNISLEQMGWAQKSAAAESLGFRSVAAFERFVTADDIKDIKDFEHSIVSAKQKSAPGDEIKDLAGEFGQVKIQAGELSKVLTDRAIGAALTEIAGPATNLAIAFDQVGTSMPVAGFEMLSDTMSKAEQLVGSDFKGASDGLTSVGTAMSGMAEALKAGDVTEMIESMKALAPAFEKLGGALALGFVSAFAAVDNSFKKMFENMKKKQAASGADGESMSEWGKSIYTGYDSAFTETVGAFEGATAGMTEASDTMTGGMSSSLDGMISAVDTATGSAMTSVSEAATEAAASASDAMSNVSGPDLELDPDKLIPLAALDVTMTSVSDIAIQSAQLASDAMSNISGPDLELDPDKIIPLAALDAATTSVSDAAIQSAQLASDAMSNIAGPEIEFDPDVLVPFDEAAKRVAVAMQFSPELEISATDLMFPTPDNAAAIAALKEIEEQFSLLTPEPISLQVEVPDEISMPELDTSVIIADLMETDAEFKKMVDSSGVSTEFITRMWEEMEIPGIDTSSLSDSLSGMEDAVTKPLSAVSENLMTMAESGNMDPLLAKLEALREGSVNKSLAIANASMEYMAELEAAASERGIELPPADFSALETSITSAKGAITTVVDEMSSSTETRLSGISDIDVSPGTEGIVNLTDQTTALLDAAESLVPGFSNAGESMTDSLTSAVETMPSLSEVMLNPDALLDTVNPAMDQVSAMADQRRTEIDSIASEIQNVEIPGPGSAPIKTVEVDLSSGMNKALESLSKLSDSIKATQPEQVIDLKLNVMLDGGAIATIKKKIMASPAVGGRTLVTESE